MKKLIITLIVSLISVFSMAQSPEKISYQALIRDADNELVANEQLGMQISILQHIADGNAVYMETQNPVTNQNGLISIEIGAGSILSGDFASIDWSNGPYFIKTEIDTQGGTNYTIVGATQLLSVPYALHAKTAENLKGGITEFDPTFNDNFDFLNAKEGDMLLFDGRKWVRATPNYLSEVTESDVKSHEEALTILKSQISDLGTILEEESDPAFTNNFDFNGAIDGDLLQFDGVKWSKLTPDYISNYSVTQEDVKAHESAISITKSQISDLGTFVETEADPLFSDTFDFTGANDGDLLQYNGAKWVKMTPGYLSEETDPTFTENLDLTGAVDGDLLKFNGTKWVKMTPNYLSSVSESDVKAHESALSITESQISDLGNYIESETQTLSDVLTNNNSANIQIKDLSDPTDAQDAVTLSYLLNFLIETGVVGSISDIDGNSYRTVKIGSQRWMADNLKTTQLNDGTPIDLEIDGSSWATLTTPAYCYYDNNASYKDLYGILYNYYTVQTEKVCPTGWHVPTGGDWDILAGYLGGANIAGGKLKMKGTDLWNSPNIGATNEKNFSAVPAGHRIQDGVFAALGERALFWTGDIYTTAVPNADIRWIYYNQEALTTFTGNARLGLSIRCVENTK